MQELHELWNVVDPPKKDEAIPKTMDWEQATFDHHFYIVKACLMWAPTYIKWDFVKVFTGQNLQDALQFLKGRILTRKSDWNMYLLLFYPLAMTSFGSSVKTRDCEIDRNSMHANSVPCPASWFLEGEFLVWPCGQCWSGCWQIVDKVLLSLLSLIHFSDIFPFHFCGTVIDEPLPWQRKKCEILFNS